MAVYFKALSRVHDSWRGQALQSIERMLGKPSRGRGE